MQSSRLVKRLIHDRSIVNALELEHRMKNPQAESEFKHVYDILGIGFGPANLALAIALEENLPEVTSHFLEAKEAPAWQDGMLLAGSNIQNHPVRDLVTLRNPRSRYSFINYLFEENRLIEHLNLPLEFPLRKEYAQYFGWVAKHFSHQVNFGAEVVNVRRGTDGAPVYVATSSDGRRFAGRALVVGPGRTPYVPHPFASALGPTVFHLVDYLPRVEVLPQPPKRVAVIGGSQSAVEIILDLAKRFPDAEVVGYVRSFGLRLKDTSPFSEEGYFPDFTKYYYGVSRDRKHTLDRYLRLTNYSSADADVLHELYVLIYEQRLDGCQRVCVRGNRQVIDVSRDGDRIGLVVAEVNYGEIEKDDVDLVVIATGFRDLGPEENQEPYPAMLAGLSDHLTFDQEGYLAINEDYSLVTAPDDVPPIFLNGICESSHGIGDSGSFSLLSLRAAAIARGYLAWKGRRHKAAREMEDSTA